MLASKYLYDEGVDEEVYNDEWAEAASMRTDDVNTIEREFLRAIVSCISCWIKPQFSVLSISIVCVFLCVGLVTLCKGTRL